MPRSETALSVKFRWLGKDVFSLVINCSGVLLMKTGYLCLASAAFSTSLVSWEDIASWEEREADMSSRQHTPLEAVLGSSGPHSSWRHYRMKWFLIVLLIFPLFNGLFSQRTSSWATIHIPHPTDMMPGKCVKQCIRSTWNLCSVGYLAGREAQEKGSLWPCSKDAHSRYEHWVVSFHTCHFISFSL